MKVQLEFYPFIAKLLVHQHWCAPSCTIAVFRILDNTVNLNKTINIILDGFSILFSILNSY